MKASVLLAATLAASTYGAALDARQRRPTSRPVAGPGDTPDVSECGLDAFVGHTSEALLFCSSLLRQGTATRTSTYSIRTTTTTTRTIITTLYPPSVPSSTPLPPTSIPQPPSSAPPPPPSSTPVPPSSTPVPSPSSTPVPPSSTPVPPPSSTPIPPPPSSSPIPPPPSSTPVPPPSSTVVPPSSSPSPTPSPGVSCGIVGYTKSTAAYYFDSSGTKNTWKACGDLCKADTKCKSWGYGEANCMLFDVPAADNTNYNPMSPYTFYDQSCPEELPVKKRQINISLGLPGGPPAISSACSCLITSAPAGTTKTTTVSTTQIITTTQSVTRTVSLLPPLP